MDHQREIAYGEPGPPIDRDQFPCRVCWEDQQVWYGNAWGMKHTGAGLHGCDHSCHIGEVYLA